MELSLVVLAAGMGSRYGGLKQLDPVGPSGEIILDYSVSDALGGWSILRLICPYWAITLSFA
jgi:CTP:molybdopterin cytidylyltransferase MocA